MSSTELTLRYNSIHNVSDTSLTFHEESWNSFKDSLRSPRIGGSKNGPAIVPVRFRPGGTRRNEDAIAHTMVVLDIDNKNNTLTREDIEHKLDGYEYVAHTTFSSTAENPKWRIILPVERELPHSDYELIYEYFASLFGEAMDKSCGDMARLFYKPTCKTSENYDVWSGEGKIFSVGDAIQDGGQGGEYLPAEKKKKTNERRYYDLIPSGEINNTFQKMAGQLWAFGWPKVAILAAIKAVPTEVPSTPGEIEGIVDRITKKERGVADLEIYAFNEQHFIVHLSGDTKVVKEEIDPVLGVSKLTFFSPQSFVQFYAYIREKAQDWFGSPHARRFDGIIFDPRTLDAAPYYNLWKSFGCEPRAGVCDKYLAHIRGNVCDNDEFLYSWLISWMAAVVQHPAVLCGTAVVLRGGQGVGKSLACKLFGELFGPHFIQISNKNQLVGNFSGPLIGKVLVVAEEATFAGDRIAEGRLKTLVTEDTMVHEEKYQKPFTVRNCCHLMMCSNQDWVVMAGADERRFVILDVAKTHQQDRKYFAAILSEYYSGGREALLYFLQNFVIPREIDVGVIPHTHGLMQQKLYSAGPEVHMLLEHLADAQEGVPYIRQIIYEKFQSRAHNRFMSETMFWMRFTRAMGGKKTVDHWRIKRLAGDFGEGISSRPLANVYMNIKQVRALFVKEFFPGRTWEEAIESMSTFSHDEVDDFHASNKRDAPF